MNFLPLNETEAVLEREISFYPGRFRELRISKKKAIGIAFRECCDFWRIQVEPIDLEIRGLAEPYSYSLCTQFAGGDGSGGDVSVFFL